MTLSFSKAYIIGALFRSIRRRGVAETALMFFFEAWYGLKYGLDTAFVESSHELDFDSEVKKDAKYYSPTNYYLLRKVFAHLKDDIGAGTFVDIGCGAGRILIFASDCGFRRVVGVDASRRLCDTATRTLDRYYAKKGTRPDWRIVHADARHFPIENDYTVFFLFNPFGEAPMAQVADNIERSFRAARRPMAIVYVNAVHAEVFERNELFRLTVKQRDYRIYRLGGDDKTA